MELQFSNSESSITLPQTLETVNLSAPGPLRVEDDTSLILAAATTFNAGTGLSASDDGDGTVTVSASAQNGVGVEDSGASILSTATSLNFGTALSVVDDGDGTVTIDGEATDPAGSDTQIQFNDAGSFGASSGLTFDTGTLTVQGDGTLLDLQDSDSGDSLFSVSNNEVSVIMPTNGTGVGGSEDLRIGSGNDAVRIKGASGGYISFGGNDGTSVNRLTRIERHTNDFFLINEDRGNIYLRNGKTNTLIATPNNHIGIGTDSPTATITAQAKSGQTDPLLQLNDETGSAVFTYDGTLTVQGDGTLLDLQDSDGDSVTVSSGATSFRGQKGVIITTEGSGAHPGRIPIDTGGKKPIFTEMARFPSGINTSTINSFGQGPILIDSNNGVEWMQDNNVTATLNENKYFGVGLSNPTATITAQAKSGQTDPLLQLNDETGSSLIQDTVSGDREYKAPGKGVILTSPDGGTTKRVYLDNNGDLVTETI